jgi:hypothetical protein
MAIYGRVHHIQDYTPFDIKTADSNTIKDIGKTYYPVKVFFQHHEATSHLFRGERGLMMVGNIMESPTGILEPSIRDIELYHPHMGDGRHGYDESGTIMMVDFMVKGSLIYNNWIKEHAFYELLFLVHDLKNGCKRVISPNEFTSTNQELDKRDGSVRVISFGLRRVTDEDVINSIK